MERRSREIERILALPAADREDEFTIEFEKEEEWATWFESEYEKGK